MFEQTDKTNHVDPAQSPFVGAAWSEFTQFAIPSHFMHMSK